MSESQRVPCVVGRSEAEEIMEHRAHNTTARTHITALTVHETNAWFALTIKTRDMKEAEEWRVASGE